MLLSLTNVIENNEGSTKKASEEISIVATEETSIQSAKETHIQIAVKSETLNLEEMQIQPVEEIHNQIVDESETLNLGNTHIPSSNETWTLTVEGTTETQAVADTQIPLTEVTWTEAVDAKKTQSTGETQFSSAEQTETRTFAEHTHLARDESQIQSTLLVSNPTAEYMTNRLTVRFPEESQSQNMEGSEPQILEGKDVN